MKKITVLLSASLFISLLGFSQNVTPDKVPAPVKQSFAKKFPAAIDIKYEMEKKDYEINFKEKGVEMSANFDATGHWLETETVMKETGLPKEVASAVAKNFPLFTISEIAKVETPGRGLIYEMDLKKGIESYEVQFSPKGDILNKSLLRKGNNLD